MRGLPIQSIAAMAMGTGMALAQTGETAVSAGCGKMSTEVDMAAGTATVGPAWLATGQTGRGPTPAEKEKLKKLVEEGTMLPGPPLQDQPCPH